MTVIRIRLDVFLEDTSQTRGILNNLWNILKQNRSSFKRMDQGSDESSFVSVEICQHDVLPFTPCTQVKRIEMDVIEKDDVL